jgi:peptidoglycan/LPS O-acetylase OafA/YrhL
LRAVAVLAVVLYHAHVGLLRGGFTGVDVFYVISGFVITGMLWRQLDGEGVSLRSFYRRRIQRLLPVSFAVLVVTAAASAVLLPPLEAHATLKDGVSAALYVSNYRFAALQTNYLTASAAPSPFQQYWSLSLEEQFYLVWPVLLVCSSVVWARVVRPRTRARHARRPPVSPVGAVTALAVLGTASFLFSLWLTNVAQPWAFFSLPSRAWELCVGGLVAFATPWLKRLAERPAAAVGWVGLAAIVGAAVVLSGSTGYPGTAALLPVLGTAAVIASGSSTPRTGPVRVLGRTGPRVVGRVSYSWYLWHWPILILAPFVVGHALSLGGNLVLVVATFLVAVVSFVTIEDPVRLSSWLRTVPRRITRMGAALTAAAVATCMICIGTLPSLVGHGNAPVARLAAAPAPARSGPEPPSSAPRPSPTDAEPGSAPAVVSDSPALLAPLRVASAQAQAAVARSLPVEAVPANLTPSLAAADGDEPPVFVDGCLDSYLSAAVEPCDFGDTASARSVVLFGDSHAAMWFPAVDSAADRLGLNLHTWTKATCPPLDIPIFSPVLGRNFVECGEWRQAVLDHIADVRPALVILGVARHYTDVYGFTPYSAAWLSGLSEMVESIRRLGSQVLVIGPVPKPPFDVPGCLSVHLTSARACTVPLAGGINGPGQSAEISAVTAAGGRYLVTQPWFCTSVTCAVMVDNLLVYRDDNHLTATYAAYLAPAMTDELALVLGIGPDAAPAASSAPP